MDNLIFNLYKNREVRVFISSTFRDMMDEREYLVKHVFPILRKKYADRGVTITEVDLRWGVLEEEAENGKVIDICLTEIDNSRPYFIGILGERYGWVPDNTEYEKHKKIIENFNWVVQDIESNLSITEMEIQYGVLRKPEMLKRSAFYFRDGSNKNSKLFKKLKGSKEEEKLKTLKTIIGKKQDLVTGKFTDAAELGNQVIEHLSNIIEADFPVLDENTKKISSQLNFINSRRKVYVKEKKYFDLITNHVERVSSPIVVSGKIGSGTSSLLANYLVEYAQTHQEDILLYNFSNASEKSSNHILVLKRFCEELSGREINLQQEFLENTGEQLKNYFEDLIIQKAPQKILIVLDGLDEFDNNDNALLLNWLPYSFNGNAKVIYSCCAGETLDRLKNKRYEFVYVSEPNNNTKQEFINKYLLGYSKKLPAKYVENIVNDDISNLPLTLKSFLDELRQFGLHEELQGQINYYTSADGAVEVYDRILERLENDYEENRKGLIKNIFSLLHITQSGLTETEILVILEIPLLHWTPIYNAIENNLSNMNGQLSIAHKYLLEAVEKRYLVDIENKNAVSKKIISCFFEDRKNARAVQEVAHQYILLEDKKGLYEYLSNIEVVISLFITKDNELLLLQYWIWLSPEYFPSTIYSPTMLLKYIDEKDYGFTEAITIISVFGLLFKELGQFEIAQKYFEAVYEWSKEKLDESDDFIRASLARLVLNSLELNYVNQADKYALEAVSLCDKYLNEEDSNYIAAYSNLGLVLSAKEKFSEAIKIYEKLIEIIDKDNTKTVKDKLSILNNLATAYFNNNFIDDSIRIYKELISIEEELYGSNNSDNITALSNLGFIYSEIGKYKKAHDCFGKGISICKKNFGEFHHKTISILFNFVELLLSEGNLEMAGEYLDKISSNLNEEYIEDEKHGLLLHLRAQLESSNENIVKSIELEKAAYNIFEKLLGVGHKSTIYSLFNLAAFHLQAKHFELAEEVIRTAENILLEKGGDSDIRLAEIYNLYGGLYKECGELSLAEDYIKKGLELRTNILGDTHKDTIKNIQNFAVILYLNNKTNEAKEVIEYNLQLTERKFGKDSIRYCENLEIINEILIQQKEFSFIESNLLHIYEFYNKTYGQNSKVTYNTVIKIINVKRDLGYDEQVILLLPQAVEIAKNIWDESDINYQNMLLDTGMRYSNYGKHEKSIELFNELYEIQIKTLGKFNNQTLLTLNNIAGARKLAGDLDGARKDFDDWFNSIEEKNIEYNVEILNCLSNYARIKFETGDIQGAVTLYQIGLEKALAIFGLNNSNTIDHLFYLANIYCTMDEEEKAESLYHEYLAKLTSTDEETEKTIIEVLRLLTNVMAPKKEYDKLEPLLLRRSVLSEKIYGINSVQTIKVLLLLSTNYQLNKDYQNSVAILNRIGSECESETLYSSGENYVQIYTDLVSFYNENNAEERKEEVVDEGWKEKINQNKGLIEEYEGQGDNKRILDLLADNIAIFETHLGDNHPDTVFCKREYAYKLIAINQFEYANKILVEVLEKLKKSLGVIHGEYTFTLYSLAKTEKGLGKFDDALINFKKVRDQVAADADSNHQILYEIDKQIANTYFSMNKNEEAISVYSKLLESLLDNNVIERAYLLLQIGQLYIRLEMHEDAIKCLNEAELFYETQFKENNPYSIMIPDLKANIYWNKEELELAEKFYCQAVGNARKILPPSHPAYIKTIKTIALFYFNNNRFSESLVFHLELLENFLQNYETNDQIVVEQKLTVSLIHHNLENHNEAVKLLSEAIEAEPENLCENSQKMMMNLYDYYSEDE